MSGRLKVFCALTVMSVVVMAATGRAGSRPDLTSSQAAMFAVFGHSE
ncbi:hypothetical protein [Shimia sp.]